MSFNTVPSSFEMLRLPARLYRPPATGARCGPVGSTTDRRVVHIRLSDKGQKLAQKIQVEPMEIFRGALLGLSQGDLKDLLRIMNKLQRAVRANVAAEQGEGGRTTG